MTNREIFDLSLNLLAQDVDSTINLDFEERAPYLLALFCIEACEVDNHLRRRMGMEEKECPQSLWIDLEGDFPMLDALVPAAAYYLSAMLILDENDEQYDRFYERYSDAMSRLRCDLPCELEPIGNAYFQS